MVGASSIDKQSKVKYIYSYDQKMQNFVKSLVMEKWHQA